jgi:hypothetical protein
MPVRGCGGLRRQPVVRGAFVEHVRVPLAAPLCPVKVLGIDETLRGRTIWAQDPDTKRWLLANGRWHSGFAGTGDAGADPGRAHRQERAAQPPCVGPDQPERPIIRNRFDNFYRHAATSLAGHCSVTLEVSSHRSPTSRLERRFILGAAPNPWTLF